MKRVLVGLIAGLALAGGVAYATTSVIGSGGVIQGCYKQLNGQLRVVESSSDCTSAETPISWNAQGPKGDKGEPGTKGDKGDKGDPGTKGAPGTGFTWRGAYNTNSSYDADDVVSSDGSSWIAIAHVPATPCAGVCIAPNAPPNATYWEQVAQKGDIGAAGPQGPQGATGPQGPQGPAGPTQPPAPYFVLDVKVSPNQLTDINTPCPAGKHVTGGGYTSTLPLDVYTDMANNSSNGGFYYQGWQLTVLNTNSVDADVSVTAYCI